MIKTFGISTKVFMAFAAMLIIFGGVLGYVLYQVDNIQQETRLIHRCHVPLSISLVESHNLLTNYSNSIGERDPVLLRQILQAQRNIYPFTKLLREKLEASSHHIQIGRETSPRDEELQFLNQSSLHLDALKISATQLEAENEAFRRTALEEREEAQAQRQHLKQTVSELQNSILELRHSVRKETSRAMTHSEKSARESIGGFALLAIAASAIALGIMFIVHRTLRPIHQLIAATRELGLGAYTARVPVVSNDEIGMLAKEFNGMVDKLQARDNDLRERRDQLSETNQHLTYLQAYSKNILDSVASGIIAVDASLKVTSINRAAKQLWGLELNTSLGRPLASILPFTDLQDLEERLQRVLSEAHPDRLRAVPLGAIERLQDAEGGALHTYPMFDLLLVPLSQAQTSSPNCDAGVLVIGDDVTQELHTRRELIKKERLAAIGRMSSQVTHELRNPLSSIGLNAEMLQEELEALGATPDSEPVDLLSSIIQEVERLTEITEEYLSYARLPEVHPLPTDLNALLSNLLHFMRAETNQRRVHLCVDLADKLPLAHGDPNQLRRAVLNLFRNAIEAMPTGGSLSVLTRIESPQQLLIEISDSGPGIPEQDLARIFDPFFSTKITGTGLGLPLTHQIIEEHGGQLLVSSTLGQGTVFRILLPSAEHGNEDLG